MCGASVHAEQEALDQTDIKREKSGSSQELPSQWHAHWNGVSVVPALLGGCSAADQAMQLHVNRRITARLIVKAAALPAPTARYENSTTRSGRNKKKKNLTNNPRILCFRSEPWFFFRFSTTAKEDWEGGDVSSASGVVPHDQAAVRPGLVVCPSCQSTSPSPPPPLLTVVIWSRLLSSLLQMSVTIWRSDTLPLFPFCSDSLVRATTRWCQISQTVFSWTTDRRRCLQKLPNWCEKTLFFQFLGAGIFTFWLQATNGGGTRLRGRNDVF